MDLSCLVHHYLEQPHLPALHLSRHAPSDLCQVYRRVKSKDAGDRTMWAHCSRPSLDLCRSRIGIAEHIEPRIVCEGDHGEIMWCALP